MVFRLSAFYFMFFVYGGAYVAYFPLYLADRGLSAAELGWVLALPPLARAFAPAAWGWIADRYAAHRAVVVFSCAVTAAAFAVLPFTHQIGLLIGVMSVLSAGALPLVEAITLGSLAGEQADPGALVLEQRFTLTRDLALRFDLSRQRESGRTFDTALLSLQLHF